MNGLLDWTQIVHKSKKIDEIYDTLLAFPTKANTLKDDDDDDQDDDIQMMKKQIKINQKNSKSNKNSELRSMSPSTTVFNASYSSFDEFHIQALVQILSLKSPRWENMVTSKIKFLK